MFHAGVRRVFLALAVIAAPGLAVRGDHQDPLAFVRQRCVECHSGETPAGLLDLSTVAADWDTPEGFTRWVRMLDRVAAGEMPPDEPPPPDEREAWTTSLHEQLLAADRQTTAGSGRAVWRRLNRYEYEQTLRDLLGAPWLPLKEMLPEDGEAYRFNKVGEALETSFVQMARYLSTADAALRSVLATAETRPPPVERRLYARRQRSFQYYARPTEFNRDIERLTFPLLGTEPDLEVLRDPEAPLTVGDDDPVRRDREALGAVASSYEAFELRFDQFRAPRAGRYRITLRAYSFWAGLKPGNRWKRPDREATGPGRRPEPVVLYAESPPNQLRRIGGGDFGPEPTERSFEAWLRPGETIRVDAVRLFRTRPPNWVNPLATDDGVPGVAFQWLEVAGPLDESWPPVGHRVLLGDLPFRVEADARSLTVSSQAPEENAAARVLAFVEHAARRPVSAADAAPYQALARKALADGSSLLDAVIAGAVGYLCSPEFLTLWSPPGPLDDRGLAERLSYFLVNSAPDHRLRRVADQGRLTDVAVLREQAERLLDDPASESFRTAFLEYWLDLRKVLATSPDATLYPDYYLDDALVEAAVDETRLFFAECLSNDLPVRTLVSSDFTFVNERLAEHYGLPGVAGWAHRRVPLPADSPRGGLLTQAAVLKVTANGTTTSPVTRGAWVMERLLGTKPLPPPPGIPAVEPDTRGAKTVREQLALHRSVESCNVCHASIDPPGLALESFDILGGWRDQYRALGDAQPPLPGRGKNGQPFEFHLGPPVDASGELPDGRPFADIRQFKQLLLADQRRIARAMVHHFMVYGTGAGIRYGDRPAVEAILDAEAAGGWGIRSLLLAVIESPLFREQ